MYRARESMKNCRVKGDMETYGLREYNNLNVNNWFWAREKNISGLCERVKDVELRFL